MPTACFFNASYDCTSIFLKRCRFIEVNLVSHFSLFVSNIKRHNYKMELRIVSTITFQVYQICLDFYLIEIVFFTSFHLVLDQYREIFIMSFIHTRFKT